MSREREFRSVLSHFPTGVCVVTSRSVDDSPIGMTIGSFTSVSLDPPLVGFLPSRRSRTWPLIADAGRFCVNFLSERQEEICRRFATSEVDRFAGLSVGASPSGMPLLSDVLAWVDCTVHAVHEAGDHFMVIGTVDSLGVERDDTPLVFFKGQMRRFGT